MIVARETVRRENAKPFLKWAGGKRWLVERYAHLFPDFDGSYFEPFLGGGSVFFFLSPSRATLSDSNARLIECYQEIRDHHSRVLDFLEQHQKAHCKSYYYDVRADSPKSREERAAQFIYLNRTCFNGLYRVNKQGVFNVPIGTKDKIVDVEEDFACIAAKLCSAQIESCDFENTIDRAGPRDFVFVDPPYTVKHNLNGFLKYNENIFSWDDQVRLRNAVVRAAERGAKILLTNAAHESVVKLYAGVGDQTFITRSSVLAGKGSARGSVQELVVSVG